jgi:hypothetical protein
MGERFARPVRTKYADDVSRTVQNGRVVRHIIVITANAYVVTVIINFNCRIEKLNSFSRRTVQKRKIYERMHTQRVVTGGVTFKGLAGLSYSPLINPSPKMVITV